jgi:hypothetical protein
MTMAGGQTQLGSAHAVGRSRPGRRAFWVGALAVTVVVLFVVGFQLYQDLQPPNVTCSTPDAAACANTRNWISDRMSRDSVFAEPLPARLIAVDVRPTPPKWKELASYREGDWAALLTMDGREPVLVACYYSSDDMVACDNP